MSDQLATLEPFPAPPAAAGPPLAVPALWNALGRWDFARATELFVAELTHGGGLDPHLLCAAFDLERFTGSALPVDWRAQAETSGLDTLYRIADAYHRHDWTGVLKLSEACRSTEHPASDADAFGDCFAVRAAHAIGDLPRAQAIARAALARHKTNPLVVFLALRIELEAEFLDCPDLLVVDLASRSQRGNAGFYLDPVWPVLTKALSAWLNHRDEEQEHGQKDLDAFRWAARECPLAVLMAAPFLETMQPSLAPDLLQSTVPYTGAADFFEAHLRFGMLPPEKRAGLLDAGLRADPGNPYFRLEAALGQMRAPGTDRSGEALEQLLAELPWYRSALKAAVRAGVETDNGRLIVKSAVALLDHATSFFDAYDWIVKTLEAFKRQNELVEITRVAIRREEWRQPAARQRDDAALTRLACAGKAAEVCAFLNERVAPGNPHGTVSLLPSRRAGTAIEAMPGLDGLTPTACLTLGCSGMELGLLPLAQRALSRLGQAAAEDEALRPHVDALAEALDLSPRVSSGDVEVEVVRRALAVFLKLGINVYLAQVRAIVLSLKERGQYVQAGTVLRASVDALTEPAVLEMAVRGLRDDLNDPGAALALLAAHSSLTEHTAGGLRERCKTLEKLGRGEEWIGVARAGQIRFPGDPAFVIEEGLALAFHEQAAAAVERLYEGLTLKPADDRGLAVFRALAPGFHAHERLVAVLSSAIEEVPHNGKYRDHLIQLLGSIEHRTQDWMHHLYRRVYREKDPRDEKRRSLRTTLSALRRRLVTPPVEATLELQRFADGHRERVHATIQELQRVPGDRLLAAVFTEWPRSASETSQKAVEAVGPGLSLLWKSRGLSEPVRKGLGGLISGALRNRGYNEPAELIEVEELWGSLRLGDHSRLHRLLAGISAADFPVLNSLRMLDRHCKLLLEKLEHRLVCYFVFGSFVRGTQRIDSDIDVWVVIDDSGVRNSPEREKNLRELNENCCRMARAAFAVARRVHVQTSVLSAFVQLLHSMDPLAVRLLSEGVPLHDRGLFSAWSRLLREGRLRSTRESLESRLNELVPMQSQAASSIQTLAKDLARPIKRGCIKFLELLLEVVYFPSAYYSEEGQVIDLVRAELVERRKLLTPEELDVARRAVEFQKRVEAGTMPSLEEALQLYRQAERLIGKAPAIFRQLMLERDHAQLEALIPRIEAALASTGVGDSGSGPQAWRERLQAFYDQARSALSATGDRGLAAVRTAALMARISDIAPSVMDAESGRDPSDRTTLGVGTGPATGQPHRRTFADEQSAVHP